MSKKILFYYQCFGLGGAENSSLKLLRELKNNGYKVDIIADYPNPASKEKLSDFKVDYLCNMPYPWEKCRVRQILFSVYSRCIRYYNSFKLRNKHYDTLIIGLHGIKLTYINPRKVADKTVQFIRNDIANMKDASKVRKIMKKQVSSIDKYICVSEGVYKSFVKQLPMCKDKATTIYNLINVEALQKKIDEAINPYPESQCPIIVTVCRLVDKSKALFRMVDVCNELVEHKLNFKWYVVGAGADEQQLRIKIKEKGLEEKMMLLGHKNNPFPYYKYADIVAILSYHEGFCTTVNEAKLSGAAVIATEFSAIHEQIETGKNGMVVANNKEAIVKGMIKIIQDKEFRLSITNNYLPSVVVDDQLKLKTLMEII